MHTLIMGIRIALLAAVLLPACVGDTVRVDMAGNPTPEDLTIVEDAAGFWGLQVDFDSKSRNRIKIELVDEPAGGYFGWTDAGRQCAADVWAIRNVRTVAHEIGHAMGLAHEEEDDDNIMFWSIRTQPDEARSDQVEAVSRRAALCYSL